jgi:hypothetical protein
MMILDDSWQPSTFYNENIIIKWVFDFTLYKKIKENKIKEKGNVKFAINKNVKKAFDELYKMKSTRNTRKTRKRK